MPFERVHELYLHTVSEHFATGYHSVLKFVNNTLALEPRKRTVHQQRMVDQGEVEIVYEVESDSDVEKKDGDNVGGKGGRRKACVGDRAKVPISELFQL